MADDVSFSFCSFGVYGADNIAAQGIGFATMAKLTTGDKVWDDVLALLKARLETSAETVTETTENTPAPETKPRRPRRTKADTEADMATAKERPEFPIEPEQPAPSNDGPSLQDALDVLAGGETTPEPNPPAPPVDRDDLVTQVRARAKKDEHGPIWLREHVMCGAKYTRFADVPTDVLVAALAVPAEIAHAV